MDIQDNLTLYTLDLGADISCTIFSQRLRKVGLIRIIDYQQLVHIFKQINPDNIQEPGLIELRIIGGNDSVDSTQAVEKLLLQLKK